MNRASSRRWNVTAFASLVAVAVVAGEPPPDSVALVLQLPKPRFIGTPVNLKTPNLEKPRSGKRPDLLVPAGAANVALHKPVTASDTAPTLGELKQVTDGDKEGVEGSYVEIGPGTQYFQVDLQERHRIFAIVVWHYHAQARVYRDVVVQLSDDPAFKSNVRTVYNNDHDNSSGFGVGEDKEYIDSHEGLLVDAKGAEARYVRLSGNGNTENDLNHCTEVEVYGKKSPAPLSAGQATVCQARRRAIIVERKTRRSFLRDAALGGAGAVILANARSARTYAANEKLNVALIGVGGRGKWYVDVMPKQANVVALCDVNESKAQAAYKALPEVPKFHDFREMFDKMNKEIDGVIVATPDHTHASAAITAMKLGKHAFVEKPMAGCVYEARMMREVAEKQKVATQMGNQGSSGGQFRRGVELIEDGVLGEIKEVYVWNSGGGAGNKEPPKEEQKIPPYLKWDLWLGPIKDRPFNAAWLGWSMWRELGTGQIGMWGSHTNYLTFMALKIASLWKADPATKPRIKVRAEVASINRCSFPQWEKIDYIIPARGDLPPVTIHWVNGGMAPGWKKKLEELVGDPADWPEPKEQEKGKEEKKKWSDFAGAFLLGTKGRMHSTGHNYTIDLLPAKQFQGVDINAPKRLTQSHGMPEPDWLHVARDGKWTAWSAFSRTGPYMEMLLLGNIATQFDQELEYDPLEGKIIANAEADAALRREYRQGWSL